MTIAMSMSEERAYGLSRDVPLQLIAEHPSVRSAMRDLGITGLTRRPEDQITAEGVRALIRRSPYQVLERDGIYQCYQGCLLLDTANRLLARTELVPVIVRSAVTEDEVLNSVITEALLVPIWERQTSNECKRTTDVLTRLLAEQKLTSMIDVKTRQDLARLLKRSLTALRQPKKPK